MIRAGQAVESRSHTEAIEAHDLLVSAQEKAEEILLLTGSASALQIWGATREAHNALDDYFEGPTPEATAALDQRLNALEALVEQAVPVLSSNVIAHGDTLTDAANWARIASLLSSGLAVLVIAATTIFISRRQRASLQAVQREKDAIVELSRAPTAATTSSAHSTRWSRRSPTPSA